MSLTRGFHASHSKDAPIGTSKVNNGRERKFSPAVHHDVAAHHISVKDLIDANIIHTGDQVWFKDQTATIQASGNISFKGMEFTSLSKWAKHVAGALGLTKHYNGWRVALHKATQRPMGQFRDKFYAEHAGLTYTFPPLESKKRKRTTTPVEPSTRKHRSATLASGERMSGIIGSPSLSDDSESNTSSHDGAAEHLEEWTGPPQRTSQRRRNLHSQEALFTVLNDSDLDSDSSDEAWLQTTEVEDKMIGVGDEPVASPCGQPGCYVCENLSSSFASQFPTWADILQLSLYSLGQIRNNDRLFFSLGEEIYPFVDRHWHKLCSKPRNSSWRQTAKMTLAHSRYADLFENGYDTLMKTGFWRLKNMSRDAINLLSSGVTSSNRGGNLHSSAAHSSLSTSPKSDFTKYAPQQGQFRPGSRGMASKSSGDEMTLLASLAAAEDRVDDLHSLVGAHSRGTRRDHLSSPTSNGSSYGLDELDEYGRQYAADRRHRLGQQFRSPEPKLPDGMHQLRKDYQALEAKYKSLEIEHRNALLQLEKFHSLLLATRKQDETARFSFAHQSELQESQMRILLEKVHRLEYELHQRNASAAAAAATAAAPSANPATASNSTQAATPALPAPTSSGIGTPSTAAPTSSAASTSTTSASTSTSTTTTSTTSANNLAASVPPPSLALAGANPMALSGMLGVSPMAKLGLLGPQALAASPYAGLYGTLPWLGANQLNTMGWGLGDLNTAAAKMQAQQIAQAQQALLMAEALKANDTVTVKTEPSSVPASSSSTAQSTN